jgi:rRNA-processing protein FCF1
MITDLDLDIYKALHQHKQTNEIYVGKAAFDWHYSEVHYTATCTRGVPFDLFDKTIVGLLQIDEALSFEQIGEILGMNVHHNPAKQQYRDEAECDILRHALDSLQTYGMIETGDQAYSYCSLTRLGREYAQQGKKFETKANQPFSLCYDHICDRHHELKKALRGLGRQGEGSALYDNHGFDPRDENLVKQQARQQAPDIYNPDEGNSFTDLELDYNKSASFCLGLWAVWLLNLETQQTRVLLYEPQTKTINVAMGQWLNQDQVAKLLENVDAGLGEHVAPLPSSDVAALYQQQQAPKKAMLKDVCQTEGLIDLLHFWHHLPALFAKGVKEVWFFLPNYSPKMLHQIAQLDATNTRIFVVLSKPVDEAQTEQVGKLIDASLSRDNLLFVYWEEQVELLKVIILGEQLTTLTTQEFAVGAACNYACLSAERLDDLPIICQHSKQRLAPNYLTQLKQTIDELHFDEEDLSREDFLMLHTLDKKAQVFVDLQQDEDILGQVYRVEQAKDALINQLRNERQTRLQANLETLKREFEEQKPLTKAYLQGFCERLDKLAQDFWEDCPPLQQPLNEWKAKAKRALQGLQNKAVVHTYVIDTNVFIESPSILSKINPRHRVVLSNTVIEELDRLKQKKELKQKVSEAIGRLNAQMKKKNSLLSTDNADLSILDKAYQGNSPDNRILSVAVKHQNEDVVLLTNDQGLQLKAQSLEIATCSLPEFLQRQARKKTGNHRKRSRRHQPRKNKPKRNQQK